MKKWKEKVAEILKTLFPEKRKEILILLALLPVMWLLSFFGEDSAEIKALLRPGFQEREERVTLSYEYRGEHAYEDTITIELKKYDEASEIIRRKLKQTAEEFHQKYLVQEAFEQIRAKPNFPTKWKEAEVIYRFLPDNLQLPDGEWNYFELFQEEKEREVTIRAELRHKEESVFTEANIRLRADAFSDQYIQYLLRQKLFKQVEAQQEQSAKEVELPTELEGNEISWKPLESKIDFKKMTAIMLVFLVIMSVLSRATAKEKERKRKKRYLRDFGQMLHHLVLLLKCGKNPYSALVTVCQEPGTFGPDFKEAMQTCYQKIYHQENMKTAIAAFDEKCSVPEIKRFEQLYLMAYERGDEWSIGYLEEFRDELFTKRLREVNEYMQKATSRLIFPMVLFLLVIIILTIVPAFEGM